MKKELPTVPLPLDKEIVDICMIGAAPFVKQPKQTEYFSTSIREIDHLLDYHQAHPDFIQVNAIEGIDDSLSLEDLR